MSPLLFTLVTFVIACAAGLLGALLGIGGGLIVIPALTLLLGVPIQFAIGASIVSVIATSSGGAAAYVRQHLTNLRLAMVLEVATAGGALSGACLAGLVGGRWLFIVFGAVMGYTALAMFLDHRANRGRSARPVPACRTADRLRLHDSYYDENLQQEVPYRITRLPLGFAVSYIAGVLSGLLGIGGGAIKVPAMNLAMRVPIKVSSATSNFMIGVTAAASAGVYFMRGSINPFIAAPVAAGVLVGATFGARLLGKSHSATLRIAFVLVLLWISGQMLWKGLKYQAPPPPPASGAPAVTAR